MHWYQIFYDGPEYEERKRRGEIEPPNISLKDVHDAVPRHLLERSTITSFCYIARHLAITSIFFYLGTRIDVYVDCIVNSTATFPLVSALLTSLVRPILWLLYWGWQGFAFAGIWCLGRIIISDFHHT